MTYNVLDRLVEIRERLLKGKSNYQITESNLINAIRIECKFTKKQTIEKAIKTLEVLGYIEEPKSGEYKLTNKWKKV